MRLTLTELRQEPRVSADWLRNLSRFSSNEDFSRRRNAMIAKDRRRSIELMLIALATAGALGTLPAWAQQPGRKGQVPVEPQAPATQPPPTHPTALHASHPPPPH